MAHSKEETDHLKRYCGKLGHFEEGGKPYYLLEALRLPDGCQPSACDALLCPVESDGYSSRLYFSAQIAGTYTRNWNVQNLRIGERNWFAFSWQTNLPPTATLGEMLIAHLGGFAKK